jgi:multiple sugar transport system ATP-binding protein
MGKLELKNITKRFGDVLAVNDISFELDDGDLLVLVGPSGCGKSTTLRMIAGLETPTEGQVLIGGEDVTNVTPKYRDIAMVYQDLALYPHKTVRENIQFPLEMRNELEGEREEKVREIAEILEIEDMLDRYPSELSGGQQQRVALGRAIIRDPSVFLMDEPLSSLDAKLRNTMRSEILQIQQTLDETMVYVTHDQEIGMTLGDKIVVMNEGELQQLAEPKVIYSEPANEFVANFIGSPDMNIFDADVRESNGAVEFTTQGFTLRSRDTTVNDLWQGTDERTIRLGIRPQDIYLPRNITWEYDDDQVVTADLTLIEDVGSVSNLHLEVNGVEMLAQVNGMTDLEAGDSVTLVLDMEKLHFFDKQTGERITDSTKAVAQTK